MPQAIHEVVAQSRRSNTDTACHRARMRMGGVYPAINDRDFHAGKELGTVIE
jgi:hypothetical protein